MIDIGFPDLISFSTFSLNYKSVYGSETLKQYNITPSWSPIWNFKSIAIFLNEMKDFVPVSTKPTRIYKAKNEQYRTFKFMHSLFGEKFLIFLHIKKDYINSIEVSVSKQMLISEKKFFKETQKSKFLFSYEITFTEPRPSTKAIINSDNLAFFDINDFGPAFIYFTRIITFDIPENRFTSFFFEFSDIFFNRANYNSISSLCHLKSETQGYLKILTVNKKVPNLFKLNEHDDAYVYRGCYVSPFAKSIFKKSSIIDGIMLDGTFKVLKNYVTCLVMCISKNTGIPVGFSFSKIENCDLYDIVFETFLEIVGVDLSQFQIESDEGQFLLQSLSNRRCKHLSCLRHLQANVQKRKYGFQVSKLVSARCKKDFESLVQKFESIFQKIDEEKDLSSLEDTLNYVGLTFINKEIDFLNLDRWSEVSMIERSSTGMPSTTNSIESTHGHLNELTPRRNYFYSSLYRLIMTVMSQIHSFNAKMHHNYRILTCEIKNSSQSDSHINEKCQFYNSNLESCDCGETVLQSNMFKCDIPCSHRIHLGAQFPSIDDIDFQIENQFNELIIDIQEDKKTIKNIEHNSIKAMAVRSIKKFAHVKKKKKEIEKFFDDNYKPEYKEFALGYPIELFVVISNGIDAFSSQ